MVLTPWKTEVQRVVDHFALQVTQVPRVERAIRATRDVALPCIAFSQSRIVDAACGKAGTQICRQSSFETGLFGPRHTRSETGGPVISRELRVESGKVTVLRVGEVDIVAAEVCPSPNVRNRRHRDAECSTYCVLKYAYTSGS